MVEVGAVEDGDDQGGCGYLDLGTDLLGDGSVGHAVRVEDMGHETPHWECSWRISPKGGPQADGEATSARERRRKGISLARERDGGGGNERGGDLIFPPS